MQTREILRRPLCVHLAVSADEGERAQGSIRSSTIDSPYRPAQDPLRLAQTTTARNARRAHHDKDGPDEAKPYDARTRRVGPRAKSGKHGAEREGREGGSPLGPPKHQAPPLGEGKKGLSQHRLHEGTLIACIA